MEVVVTLASISHELFKIAGVVREMKEARDACTRVYERLQDILEELQGLSQLPSQDKLQKYALLIQRYIACLERYHAKPLVLRLIKSTAMMDDLKRFHEDIDALVVQLQLSTARLLVNWKQQWQADGELQIEMLVMLVESNTRVLREVKDTRREVEALTSLKHELEQRHSEQTEQMTVVMRKLYAQIARLSNREEEEEEITETTSIQILLEEGFSGRPPRQKLALQWIYRRLHEPAFRIEVEALDGLRTLSDVTQDASAGLYQQVYALGSLCELTSPQAPAFTLAATRLRDITTSERRALHDALSASHPDEERQEAAEVVAILVSTKPRTHGLDNCAAHLVDLLGSSDERLVIAAVRALLSFFVDTPSTTMVGLAQTRILPGLVKLFSSQSLRVRDHAVSAIAAIATTSPTDSRPELAAAAIAQLVTLVQSANGQLRLLSVRTLLHFAQGCDSVKTKLGEASVVAKLAGLVQRGAGVERTTAVLTLGHLARDNAERQARIAESGVILALVELVCSGERADKSAAVTAIGYLSKGNGANAESISSLNAVEALIEVAVGSSSSDHDRHEALQALSHLVEAHTNPQQLATSEVTTLLAVIEASTGDSRQAELASQIHRRLSRGDAAQVDDRYGGIIASSTVEPTQDGVTLNSRTPIENLLTAVAFPSSDGNLKCALRWLYHHARDKTLRAAIRESQGATVLSNLAQRADAAYDHRLYAHGCLWQLNLDDDDGVERPRLRICEPQHADVQRLHEAMAPQHDDERRAEAIELVTCLQNAHIQDHGFTDFLPHIHDALRSQTSARLISAAARAVAVFARQLPVSGEMMIDCGVLPLLVMQLVCGDMFTADAAAEALGALAASSPAAQSHVISAGAMAPMIRLVRHGSDTQKQLAVAALCELVRGNAAAQREAAHSGAIGPLMNLLRSRDQDHVASGARGIRSLCEVGEAGAAAVVLLGAVPLLVGAFQRTQGVARREAIQALVVLSCRSSATSALVKLGVGDVMHQLSNTTRDDQLRHAARQAARNLA